MFAWLAYTVSHLTLCHIMMVPFSRLYFPWLTLCYIVANLIGDKYINRVSYSFPLLATLRAHTKLITNPYISANSLPTQPPPYIYIYIYIYHFRCPHTTFRFILPTIFPLYHYIIISSKINKYFNNISSRYITLLYLSYTEPNTPSILLTINFYPNLQFNFSLYLQLNFFLNLQYTLRLN